MANSAVCNVFIESPDTVHGRLMESTHLAGYTMARACKEFEWLLEDNKWQEVGKGFEHINDFLATLDLSEFRISIEQRKSLAKKLKKLQASQRATAKMLGVSQPTIKNDLNSDKNLSPEEKQAFKKQDITDDSDKNLSLSSEESQGPIPNASGDEMLKAAERAVAEAHNRWIACTGDMEWYTPLKYIEAAQAVMGDIDLDPATCEYAQSRIQAKKYYTVANDGLTQDWHGRIWMNPPYLHSLITQFIDKFVKEFEKGNLKQGIALTNNATETIWFHELANISNALCFTLGRIRFEKKDNEKLSPPLGQTFFYVGENVINFKKIFKEFGLVLLNKRNQNF